MTGPIDQPRARVRPVEGVPHGIVTAAQLRERHLTRHAIAHEQMRGGLHPLHRGVYAVGRPVVTRKGQWLAAVLACGDAAWLSGADAAALLEIRADRRRPWVEVTIRGPNRRRRPGILVHRTTTLTDRDVTVVDSIPVTGVVRTLIDIAPRLTLRQLERAVNDADGLGLIDPDSLRRELERAPRTHGAALLRRLLDRRTFSRTRSGLERDFLKIALRAGLPKPLTLQVVNGYEVDFYWPQLGLVVETAAGCTTARRSRSRATVSATRSTPPRASRA